MCFIDGLFILVRHCDESNIFSFISAGLLEEYDRLLKRLGCSSTTHNKLPLTNVFESYTARVSRLELKSMLRLFFDIKEIIHGEFIPSKQTNIQTFCLQDLEYGQL
jgi:hypothetical protein